MMKNKAYNYLTKTSHNHVHISVERKKIADSDAKCEAAMKELKRIYWYEKELLIVIPILLRSAVTFELVDSLTLLTKYTREHIRSLEQQFPDIGKTAPEKRTYKPVSYSDIV